MDNEKYEKLIGLVSSAYCVIEIWKTEAPSQVEWKKNWLTQARTLINEHETRAIKKSIKSKLSYGELKFLREQGIKL